jgi:hypothetical protein
MGTKTLRRSAPPTPAKIAYDEWVAAWTKHYGRTLVLPSRAAWLELRATAKRLVGLLPDPDLRAAFIAAYLAGGDRYIREHEHPLRLALREPQWVILRRRAEQIVGERRRTEAATRDAEAQVAQRPAARPRTAIFPTWTVRLLGARGEPVATKTVHAASAEGARRLAALWLMQTGGGAVTAEVVS